jgi:hypothetical protein
LKEFGRTIHRVRLGSREGRYAVPGSLCMTCTLYCTPAPITDALSPFAQDDARPLLVLWCMVSREVGDEDCRQYNYQGPGAIHAVYLHKGLYSSTARQPFKRLHYHYRGLPLVAAIWRSSGPGHNSDLPFQSTQQAVLCHNLTIVSLPELVAFVFRHFLEACAASVASQGVKIRYK